MSQFNQIATRQPFRDLSPEEVDQRVTNTETVFWHDSKFIETINGNTVYVCYLPAKGNELAKYYKVPASEVFDYKLGAPKMHFLGIPGAGPIVVDRREEYIPAGDISPELKKQLDDNRAMMEKQFEFNKQLSEELDRELRFIIYDYKSKQYLVCGPHTQNQILWCNQKEYASRYTHDTATIQISTLELAAKKDNLKIVELVDQDGMKETGAGLY